MYCCNDENIASTFYEDINRSLMQLVLKCTNCGKEVDLQIGREAFLEYNYNEIAEIIKKYWEGNTNQLTHRKN